MIAAVLGGTLLLPGSAGAALKQRVAITIPDEGQLAASRLAFKAKGTRKPKLKVKVANGDEPPAGVIVAAQPARVKQSKASQAGGKKKRKGRAAVLLAIGNVPGAGAAAAERRIGVTTEQVLIHVKLVQVSRSISSLAFEDLPPNSRSFLSVLGPEPAAERDLADRTFGAADVSFLEGGGIVDLAQIAPSLGLKTIGAPRVIAGDESFDGFADRAITAGIAAASGPPAAVDGRTYEFLTGRTPPSLRMYTYGPSPTDPSVLFNHATYTAPVSGAQVSAAPGFKIEFTPEARCSTGDGNFGTVIRLGIDAFCRLPATDDELFFDVPFTQPPPANADVGFLLPVPVYPGTNPGGELGEALAGPGVTGVIG